MNQRETLIKGFELFNQEEFHEAHEVLEDLWNELEGDDKLLVQAIIQYSVSLHLLDEGRLEGARKVYKRAIDNLEKINLLDYKEEFIELLGLKFKITKLMAEMKLIFAATELDTYIFPKLEYKT